MPHPQIIINVFGGVVQEVYCSDPRVQVTIVDWDSDWSSTYAPGLVEITIDVNRPQYAFVGVSPARPLSDLAGTDVEAALEAAEANPCP